MLHPIDQNSPLWNIVEEEFEQKQVRFNLTIIGHDGSYHQTVYAYKSYQSTDIKWNTEFQNMLINTTENHLIIDYQKISDTLSKE